MGQQQLLLIVLGVIIVGVAIVAGIGMFNAGAEEAVKDEISSQNLAIAANAQQWFKKPVALGGGGNSFTNSNGADHNYTIPYKMTSTSNGTYDVTVTDAHNLTLTGTPTNTNYNWIVTTSVTDSTVATTIGAGTGS